MKRVSMNSIRRTGRAACVVALAVASYDSIAASAGPQLLVAPPCYGMQFGHRAWHEVTPLSTCYTLFVDDPKGHYRCINVESGNLPAQVDGWLKRLDGDPTDKEARQLLEGVCTLDPEDAASGWARTQLDDLQDKIGSVLFGK